MTREVLATHAATVGSCVEKGTDGVPWGPENDAMGFQRQVASWSQMLEKAEDSPPLPLQDALDGGSYILPAAQQALADKSAAQEAPADEASLSAGQKPPGAQVPSPTSPGSESSSKLQRAEDEDDDLPAKSAEQLAAEAVESEAADVPAEAEEPEGAEAEQGDNA